MVKVQDSSQIINGLNTNDLTLNTSRSRLRRDSNHKYNGRSSSSEENSPITRRRNINNSPAKLKGTTNTESPVIKQADVSPKKRIPKDVRKKKGESFVLDVGSIMDELLESSGSHTEDETVPVKEKSKESTSKESRTNRVANGVGTPKLDPPPPSKGKGKKFETETITKTSISLVDDYRLSGRRSKDAPPSAEKHSPSPTRKIAAKPSDAPKLSELSSPTKPSGIHEADKSAIHSAPNSVALDRRRQSEAATSYLAGRKSASHDAKKEEQNRTEDGKSRTGSSQERINRLEEDGSGRYTTRNRANALDAKRKTSTEKLAGGKGHGLERKDSDQFDEDGLADVNHRTRAGSSVKRSGSFNLRRQMSGDQALGMFYHNRHSQLLDGHEAGDEGERTSVERSGSHSSPQSPVAARAAMNRVRDSGDFNTPSMPMSPLLSSSTNSDLMSEGLKNIRRTERADRETADVGSKSPGSLHAPPLSPRIVLSNNDADKSDVS